MMAKSSAAENSDTEVRFATIPWPKTIQLLLTQSLFGDLVITGSPAIGRYQP